MKRLLLLALCIPALAAVTSVVPKPLDEMVREADHVVVATVTGVDMVDQRGRPVRDRDARTGPELQKRMRFRLAVDEVLSTSGARLPRTLVVPLWSM